MRRDVFFLAALALLISAPLSAQEDRAAEFVYEAYYAVDMGETEEWNRQYLEYAVPVLRQLVEEGVIDIEDRDLFWFAETAEDIEISLEANPGTINAENLAGIHRFNGNWAAKRQRART